MKKAWKLIFWISVILGIILLLNAASYYLISKSGLSLPSILNYLYFLIAGGVLILLPIIIRIIARIVKKSKKNEKKTKKTIDLEDEKYLYNQSSRFMQWLVGVSAIVLLSISTNNFLGIITIWAYYVFSAILVLGLIIYFISYLMHRKRIKNFA